MTNEINLTYTPTEKELLAAIRTRSTNAWSFRILVLFLFSILILAGVQAVLYASTLDLVCFSLLPAAIVVGILGLFTYANPLLKKRIRQDPKYLAEQDWQLSEDEVHWKTQFSETKNQWTSYVKAGEQKDFFLLYPQSNLFTPIPKRAFANLDEQTRFRNLLKRKIAKWE